MVMIPPNITPGIRERIRAGRGRGPVLVGGSDQLLYNHPVQRRRLAGQLGLNPQPESRIPKSV